MPRIPEGLVNANLLKDRGVETISNFHVARLVVPYSFASTVGVTEGRHGKFIEQLHSAMVLTLVEGVVESAVQMVQLLANAGPVYTGAFVSNYRLSYRLAEARFDPTPGVVTGKPLAQKPHLERSVRQYAVREIKRDLPSLVKRLAYAASHADGNRNLEFSITNPTPYRNFIPWVVQGYERLAVEQGKNKYLSRSKLKRIAQRHLRPISKSLAI